MPASLQRQQGLTRRRFLLGVVAVAGGGLALTWANREKDSLALSDDALEPNAFLQLLPDGRVIFQLDKVEMGQGTMTGLVTLVAEELDLDPQRFEVRFAPVRSIFQRPMMLTGQSRSMVDSWKVLRETGAAARAMLLNAAADAWNVPANELTTADGTIGHAASARTGAYAEFVAAAAQLDLPWGVELKAPVDYRWIGAESLPRLDTEAKVRGIATYGIDVQQPGLLTAVVKRIPERSATLDSYATAVAPGESGVRGYVELPHGVAVVAEDFWTATQAARGVQLSWSPGPLAELSDARITELEDAQFERPEPDYMQREGDTDSRLRTAATVVEAEYRVPYLAHATMEPMNATVHVQADRCDLWVPTQAPDMAQSLAADLTGLPRNQVHLHTTYLGGGFGRRVLSDFVAEAVLVAREFEQPVKLMWTREDDMQHGYYRQRTAHRLRGGLNKDGAPQAWEHRQVATPTASVLMGPSVTTLLPDSIAVATRESIGAWMEQKSVQLVAAFQAREGAEHPPYSIPNTSFIQFAYDPGVPVSIWRSVGNSYNGFVVESFIDELAHAAAADPAEFRLRLLTEARHRAVLEKLLAVADWAGADNSNRGLALVKSFDTVVGQIAEIELNEQAAQRIRVRKVTCVVDCGRAVNPDIVKAQMESGIIFGLTATLYGEISINAGQVQQSNFSDYRMLMLNEAPEIEVHIVASDAEPTGVGEPGLPPIAPAVANAVFALTGERLRTLPLRLA